MNGKRQFGLCMTVAPLFALALLLMTTTVARAETIIGEVSIEADDGKGNSAKKVFALLRLPPQANVPERVIAKLKNKFTELRKGPKVLGVIEDFELTMIGDPVVDIRFSLMAGSGDTTFTITSALVDFSGDSLEDPLAFASVILSAADTDGDGNPGDGHLSITGATDHGGVYWSEYNGTGSGPGTLFASLGDTLLVDDGAGITFDNVEFLAPTRTIGGVVTSIQSGFKFTLSANDTVTGSGYFEVLIPEPSSLTLLCIGAVGLLGLARRKRRR